MSSCHETVHQEIRPSTARVLVTELSGTGHNPTPATKPCDNSKSALELSYLSREKLVGFLECLTGCTQRLSLWCTLFFFICAKFMRMDYVQRDRAFLWHLFSCSKLSEDELMEHTAYANKVQQNTGIKLFCYWILLCLKNCLINTILQVPQGVQIDVARWAENYNYWAFALQNPSKANRY